MLEEKGFRIMLCPGLVCRVHIRVHITEQTYGKKIEIVCPKCGQTFRTTIPVPAEVVRDDAPQNTFADELAKVFSDIARFGRK